MAGSKFAYVKSFEIPDFLLPNTFIVARLDGHGFHRFSDEHSFVKPNDERALRLMDYAATVVMQEFSDIVLAFGESDEYSFLFRKPCKLYNRRSTKIITTLTSLFTSAYVMNWSRYFGDTPLKYPPSFDGRIVLYPSNTEVMDYFAWRQTDSRFVVPSELHRPKPLEAHINNLYNTTFWALVQQGEQTPTQAHENLRGTVSSQKNEILFKRFEINYNEIDPRFRKGSVLVREVIPPSLSAVEDKSSNPDITDSGKTSKPSKKQKPVYKTTILHCDIIGKKFWEDNTHILES